MNIFEVNQEDMMAFMNGGYEPKVKMPIDGLVVIDKENVRVKGLHTRIPKWLTPEEVTVYDYMLGCIAYNPNERDENFYKCWYWFQKNNIDAFDKVLKGMDKI
jgi:hypothetical protein